MQRMVNIIRTRRNSMGGSPRAEVGEIDTKAPFQSVRAAVSLFGEASSPKSKPIVPKKPKSQAEEVLDKKAQFHLTLNELNKLKELLRGAESTKAEILPELDKAKRTVDELKDKLKTVNESKQSIIETADALKVRARKLEEAKSNNNPIDTGSHDAETKKEEYKAAILELDAAKQELSSLRRDFDASSEAKLAAFRRFEEAQLASNVHQARISELSKQVAAMQVALAEIKASSAAAAQEHEKRLAKKEGELQSCRLAKEYMEQKLAALNQEHQYLISANFQQKIAETNVKIESLQDQVKKTRDAFSEAQRRTSLEVEAAKETLRQVEEEKICMQNSMESLKQDLEHVGKELFEQKRKVEEAESVVSRLQAELEDKRNELEAGLVNKTSAADASDDMISTMEQLALETDRAKQEAQAIKERTEELKQQGISSLAKAKEMDSKLSSLMKEIEEAKSSDSAALQEMKNLSESTHAAAAAAASAQASTSSNNKFGINLSKEEYETLIEKADQSEKLAESTIADAMAHVEALIANQKEAAKKIEACFKEAEELKAAEEEALKTAEMAEAATRVLEAELHRRHQQEKENEPTSSLI